MTTIDRSASALEGMAALRGQRYLIVSGDSHAGPTPEEHYRSYCPEKYLEEFDEFCRQSRAASAPIVERIMRGRAGGKPEPTLRELGLEAFARNIECEGHHDPHAHLRHMDESGIAAEVVFAGGQNLEELPFMGKGWNAGPAGIRPELRSLAGWIWNRWIADYVSADPRRLTGVLQMPVWDLDAAIAEVEWGAEHGLRLVNLPAPRRDFPVYTDPVYDRLWDACAAAEVVLQTHSGGGEDGLGIESRRGMFLHIAENHWLSNRGLAQLVFGGVFHRHPNLKFVMTESRVSFAPEVVQHLESIWENATSPGRTGGGLLPAAPFILGPVDGDADLDTDPSHVDALPRRPSEYWADNCYVCGSFMAPYEVEYRHEVGLTNLIWGSDYPHCEGTWPYTREALRHTFSDVPEDEARLILGETACDLFRFDREELAPIAARIGPTPEELATPLAPDEFPAGQGGAFRRRSTFQ
ncbi:MAG: amidohydrolase family protein [Acidimicrobiia bacterium]